METADQRAAGADTDAMGFTVRLAAIGIGIVLLTALYGPRENSERAFRLLDWMKRSPEPAAPAPAPPVRLRAQRGGR